MSRHVLVPLDGSSQSEKAFDYVLEELPEVELTLLHVINPAKTFAYAADDEYFDVETYEREQRQARERAEQMLEEYREEATERDLSVETVIQTGRPADRILESIEDLDIDHVVMGSHGRTGVGRVLFGSVAETVTRRSAVPVTIVR